MEENDIELSFVERFVEIIIKPKKTFEYLAAHPDWKVPVTIFFILILLNVPKDWYSAKDWLTALLAAGVLLLVICSLWAIISLELYILGKAVRIKLALAQSYTIVGYSFGVPLASAYFLRSVVHTIGFETAVNNMLSHLHCSWIRDISDIVFWGYSLFLLMLAVRCITGNTKKIIYLIIVFYILNISLLFMINKEPEGIVERHYITGQLKAVITYKNGKLEGFFREYYKPGNLRTSGGFKNDDKDGIWKEYYDNGKLERKISYSNNRKNGAAKWYYESGKIKDESTWKNGMAYGISKGYYENGKLKWKMPWQNGKWEGAYKEYYEKGALKEEMPYKNGERNGTAKWYYKSGKLKQKVLYKNGWREGLCINYYENGVTKREGFYKDGRLEGAVKKYYETGKLEREVIFQNGVRKDTWQYWALEALGQM